MKIYIPNFEPQRQGGGWTFQHNFAREIETEPNYDEADIFFITGPTQCSHEEADQAKRDGKKIVLRLDNAVRHSRNRGTGMPRMEHFASLADLVIYQSEWAKSFLKPFIKKDGPVILNGVDLNVFNTNNRHPDDDTYLYVRSSRDEGKGWINAWYWFVNNPGKLEIVGKFSPENLEYNFDFFNGEQWRFTGQSDNMPEVYRRNKYFLYTYLNDACSNTLLEARASGCEIVDVYGMLSTGGAPEIMSLRDLSVGRMIKQYSNEMGRL